MKIKDWNGSYEEWIVNWKVDELLRVDTTEELREFALSLIRKSYEIEDCEFDDETSEEE